MRKKHLNNSLSVTFAALNKNFLLARQVCGNTIGEFRGDVIMRPKLTSVTLQYDVTQGKACHERKWHCLVLGGEGGRPGGAPFMT